MEAPQTRPLAKLIERIEREPPRRRVFWKSLAEELRRRRARLTLRRHARSAPAVAAEPAPASASAGRARRRFRPFRLALLVAGLAAAPFGAAGRGRR
jgi:hypothetical protein